nr:M14 family zinc carboxypeptidase [Blautia marasmi]
MEVQTAGDTLDGRKLYHVRMGDENASDRVLIFAGIHGREYMTCQLVMEQMGEFVENLLHEDRTYKGYSYRELLKDRAIHIIPMANPDGVTISQFGAEGMQSPGIREQVWEIADRDGARMPWKSYFRRWKSNAEGVDVNRNFDALWEDYVDGIGRPSREKYKGTAPESTGEAQALVNLTKKENFARTVSYHSSGGVIYWAFGQQGELAARTQAFANRIAAVTGYEPDGNYEELDPAGYKDWALLKRGIPSLTIEIGRADSPLPQSAYKKVLRENRYVWEEILLDIIEENKIVK